MKKTFIIPVIILVTILATAIVVAQGPVEVSPASWWEQILNIFKSTTTFTIVGQDIRDIYPGITPYADRTLIINPGTTSHLYASSYCSSGHALFDIFANNYVPRFEMIDSAYFTCLSTNYQCIVEVYCMPHPMCSSNSECSSWVGSGSVCETKSAVDATMPLLNGETGSPITSYKRCTASCTGSPKTCYRIGSGTNANYCESATYECSYSTYSTIVSSNCASGAGSYTFGSLTSCQAAIPPTSSCSNECPSTGAK